MATPVIQTTIYFPSLGQWRDVSACVDMGTTVEISEAIEAPAETNSYVAPDIQLKLYEGTASEFLLSWFDSIQPDDINWTVEIKLEGIPIFTGFVLPTSLQIDTRERWAGFTAIGKAGLLARTSADTPTFKRPTGTGWIVSEVTGTEFSAVVIISNVSGPQSSCEFLSGDRLSFTTPGGDVGEAEVSSVAPVGGTTPYTNWALVVKGLPQSYVAGTTIDLLTPYLRNVPLKTAVDMLYAAAGLGATIDGDTYIVTPIENALTPFATAPSIVGLSGTPLAISPSASPYSTLIQKLPVCGTTEGAWFQNPSPSGPWAHDARLQPSGASYPVDWSPQGTGYYQLYGPRATSGLTALVPFKQHTYTFWAYDYRDQAQFPYLFYRWGLQIVVEYTNAGPGAAYSWEYKILHEVSADGWTWVTADGPYPAVAGTTDTVVTLEIKKTCGIDILGEWLVFSAPSVTAGADVVYSTSAFDTATHTFAYNVHPGHGQVFGVSESICGVFSIDTFRENVPQVNFFQRSGLGFVYRETVSIPAGLVPASIKRNPGDNFYYALSATEEGGVQLLSYTGSTLGARAGWVPPVLFPPTPLYLVDNVDLIVIQTLDYDGSGPWPMFGLFGNQLWWIADSFAGIIPYLDTEGLSCADALAQIGVVVDAFFWVDAQLVTYFRSRNASAARTIATGTASSSTRIDDDGCLDLKRAAIWYKTVKYVTVENETDDTITGSAGLESFRDTEQSLDNASRFVTTTSFAQALAQNTLGYLGRKLALLDVEHELDGRRYEIGRTFTAVVNGVLTTYQIVNAVVRPANGTVHVQGLEM